MPWWGWLVLGGGLLAVEVAIQTEFWLAILGASALSVGLITRFVFEAPVWGQWAVFGVVVVLLAFFVRRPLNEKWVKAAPGIEPDLVGECVSVESEIAAGGSGSTRHRGTTWTARNVGTTTLAPGSEAKVVRTSGLTLEVEALD